jgi:conjugal transfer pilus assembly protein TrbC
MKQIYITVIAMITVLSVESSLAGSTNDMINRERLRRKKVVKEVLKEKSNFAKYKEISAQKTQDYQEVIETIKNKHENRLKNTKLNGFIKPVPQAIVFVSFSMPSLSLKQIIQDASRYRVPVVIRGLYENSFRKTMGKFFELVKENNKGGVLINPRWFRKYDIKTVPAVVVVQSYGEEEVYKTDGKNLKSEEIKKNKKNKKNEKSDVVYGNVPIKRALSIIAERGETSDIAKSILNRGGA